jgi:hypothetical protein
MNLKKKKGRKKPIYRAWRTTRDGKRLYASHYGLKAWVMGG